MNTRRALSLVLLAAALVAAGCGDDEEEGAVPPGAIPAAPDARPGIEPEAGEISVSDTAGAAGAGAAAVDTSGAR